MITAAQRVRLKYLNILKSPVEMSQAEQVLVRVPLRLLVSVLIFSSVPANKYWIPSTSSTLLEIGMCFLFTWHYSNSSSRRGSSPLSAIEILAIHPDFVHVPLPIEPPPCTITLEDALTKLPSKKTRAGKAKESHLETKLLPVLREQGFIADTLQLQTGKMWRGIMRLPEEVFDSSQRFQRLMAIKNQEGMFIEANIQ